MQLPFGQILGKNFGFIFEYHLVPLFKILMSVTIGPPQELCRQSQGQRRSREGGHASDVERSVFLRPA